MLEKIYSNPLRVYIVTVVIAICGLFCAFNLPVSLFPNASKVEIMIGVSQGAMTPEEFSNNYGYRLEQQLRGIQSKEVSVEKVEVQYNPGANAFYQIHFEWGGDGDEAFKEVQTVANSFASTLPVDLRDTLWVSRNNSNTGFLALSFYSQKRSAVETYDIVEPILQPRFAEVKEAERVVLYNPSAEQVTVTPNLETMLSLGVSPEQIKEAVRGSQKSHGAGAIRFGSKNINIVIPRLVESIEDLSQIAVRSDSGRFYPLSRLARVEKGANPDIGVNFKTSGFSSLIIFATPKPGGNIKKMSEDIISIVDSSMSQFPKDIQYKNLVDPSEFIRASIRNVSTEVLLAAFFAVFVLFLFIGRLKNVITAAIEIPLSMLLAFILMYLFDMNLNLISLGGLALAAGMNVDASVVVMENIFRHFAENPNITTAKQRLALVSKAVREVRAPLISATLSSLLVFAPLAFTSALTYAILGDLAKAIIFSHGFSVFVATLLVPTIRLQLFNKKQLQPKKLIIDKPLAMFERFYLGTLAKLIESLKLRNIFFLFILASLILSLTTVLPKLKKELIGEIDSDWVRLNIRAHESKQFKEMEGFADEAESIILKKYPEEISYTFLRIEDKKSARLMLRLKNKSLMNSMVERLEEDFEDTPYVNYHVSTWNPSELKLPDPPHFKIDIYGSTQQDRTKLARELNFLLKENSLYRRVWGEPSESVEQSLHLVPRSSVFESLSGAGVPVSISSLSSLSYSISAPQYVSDLEFADKAYPAYIQFDKNIVDGPRDLGAFPLSIKGKLIPLRSFFEFKLVEASPPIFTINGRIQTQIHAKLRRIELDKKETKKVEAKSKINSWFEKAKKGELDNPNNIPYEKMNLSFPEPEKELNEAISQLSVALLLSLFLIALILFFQFTSVFEVLVIMLAIPLGVIGAIVALYVFNSTLSLNSVLGIILLNGISVANSILLVDFMNRLSKDNVAPKDAALIAAKKRLRPILMTSLTTILGMLPIALGFGQGAKVLQPLGIAVSGGLGISMLLTLFLVPCVHSLVLSKRQVSHV